MLYEVTDHLKIILKSSAYSISETMPGINIILLMHVSYFNS
jgi:hypothetical protein